MVVLDTEVTPELEAEGWARDAVRVIQDCRRSDGYVVTDRIEVHLTMGSPEQAAAIETWHDYVAGQVLATSLTVSIIEDTRADTGDARRRAVTNLLGGWGAHDTAIDGAPLRCSLRPAPAR